MPKNCQRWIDDKSGMVKKDGDVPCLRFSSKAYEKNTVGAQENECHSTIPIQTEWLQNVQVKKEPNEDVPFLHQQEGCSGQVEQPLLKCESEAEWNCGIPDIAEQAREDFGTTPSRVKLEEMQHSEKHSVDNEEQSSDVEGSKFCKLARCSDLDHEVSLQVRSSEPHESTTSSSKLGRRCRSTRQAVGGTSTARVPQHLPQSSRSRDGADVATQESPEVRHRCPHCNIACPEESTLAIHVRCHQGAGDKPHCCHLCPATYAAKHHLKSHLQRHWGIKSWKCSDCSYECFTKQVLELHIRHRHSGERPYKCDFCDKAFASQYNFVVHRRIHTGERPYACRLCPATFGDCSAMRNHFLRTHSTARPHTCEHCGKSFVYSVELRRHVHMHTGDKPHLCHLCPARFTRRSSLVVHVRAHTSDRPYRCEQCEKCFVAATRLMEHVKHMHSSKPAYPCKLCPKKYKRSGSLSAHVKAHHPAEGTT